MSEYTDEDEYEEDEYQIEPETSGAAIASLILGICSIVLCLSIFTAIPAVICGHIAKSNIKKSNGQLKGDGLALGGLITGYINIAFFALLIPAGILLPALAKARESAHQTACNSQIRNIIINTTVHLDKETGNFPFSLGDLYQESDLICPSTKGDGDEIYIYHGNKGLKPSPDVILITCPFHQSEGRGDGSVHNPDFIEYENY